MLPQIASVLMALAFGVSPGTATHPTHATIARLKVEISTTSDWTQVVLTPGRLVAQRVVSRSPGLTVASSEKGWVLKSRAGGLRTLVVEAVYEEPTKASTVRVAIEKGWVGRTLVSVINTSYTPFAVTRILNDLPRGGSGGVPVASHPTQMAARLDRFRVFGAENPALKHADSRHLVLAFYYPWFGRNSYDDPTHASRPLQKLGVFNPPDVLAMTQQAKAAGIDGFVVSWQGADLNGKAFDVALHAAEEAGTTVSIQLDLVGANVNGDRPAGADVPTVTKWLGEALDRANASKAFLRSGGMPVVFVYQMGRLGPQGWRLVLAHLANKGQHVRLVGDAPMDRFGGVSWGFHQYDPDHMTHDALATWNLDSMLGLRALRTHDATGSHLFAATVSPGYDDHNVPSRHTATVARGTAGEQYAATWNAALASDPDWVLITTWNEWFEGTFIQPDVLHGDLALRQTAEFARRFGS